MSTSARRADLECASAVRCHKGPVLPNWSTLAASRPSKEPRRTPWHIIQTSIGSSPLSSRLWSQHHLGSTGRATTTLPCETTGRPVRAPLPRAFLRMQHRGPSGPSYLRPAPTLQQSAGCRSPWLRSTTSATAELPALVFNVGLMVTLVEGVIPQASSQVDTVPRAPDHVACFRRHPGAIVLPNSRSPDLWPMALARNDFGEPNLEALPYKSNDCRSRCGSVSMRPYSQALRSHPRAFHG